MAPPSGAWIAAVEHLGGDAGAARRTAEDMESRYGEDHRRYHTGEHIGAVLRHAGLLGAEAGLSADDRAVLALAVCAHDVIYDTAPGRDERASADWARLCLAGSGIAGTIVERVVAAVLATASHTSDSDDPVVHVLLDADLAILAAPPAIYDAYAAAVRAEYSDVGDEDWRTGRIRVLQSLVDRQILFVTPSGRDRWDALARANLMRELATLIPD